MVNARHHLLFESVVEHIRLRVQRGELKPGSKLPTINQLAAELKVSAASVREAYHILQSQGLLQVTQGRGTFVSATLDKMPAILKQFRVDGSVTRFHVLEARRQLEPGIARFAAERGSDMELARILEMAESCAEQPPSSDAWLEENILFHDRIAVAARNPIFRHMLMTVYDLIRVSEPQFMARAPEAQTKAIDDHLLIAEALSDRNGEAAAALMQLHIGSMETRLKRAENTHSSIHSE